MTVFCNLNVFAGNNPMFFQYEDAFDDAYSLHDQADIEVDVHEPETTMYVVYRMLQWSYKNSQLFKGRLSPI